MSEHVIQELILIRGVHGTGKTTTGQTICRERENFQLVEADMFGPRVNDQVTPAAEAECRTEVEELLKLGKNVVVANTFVTHASIMSYMDLAYHLSRGREVRTKVYRLNTEFGTDVPESILAKMRADFQPWPGEEVLD